jgi:pimeloyl-ACP methyl ester carboxylesterase
MTPTRIRIGDVTLAVIDEGNGPPVLLLHGFPDSARLWQHQLPVLRGAGLRVVAPDLRGFGDSDKPVAVDAYALPHAVRDVVGLLDTLRIERALVVGHDWGAAVAWMLAALHPERVERLVSLGVGHPHLFLDADLAQREKAWYTLLFQFRDVAEQLLMRDDWRLFREWARHHDETERWIRDLSRPGALTAGLNWYRANAAPHVLLMRPRALPRVQAPTLAVWAGWDMYVTEAQVARSSAYVSGSWRYERLEGVSHWLPLDNPARINTLLIEFLLEQAPGRRCP